MAMRTASSLTTSWQMGHSGSADTEWAAGSGLSAGEINQGENESLTLHSSDRCIFTGIVFISIFFFFFFFRLLSLTRLQLPGTNSLFLSVMLPKSVLSNIS